MLIRRIGGSVAMVVCAASLLLSTGAMAQTAVKTEKKESATTTTAVKHLKLQTSCPIMGGAIDKKQFVDYKGKRIYVCCEGCLAQVKKDPEAAIKKLASLGQEPETIATVTPPKTEVKPAAVKDTSMKGMDMGSDTSMKGMDHSTMK